MMIDTDTDGRLDATLLKQEELWRDRTPPELEWDESEAALVVEDMLGGPQRYRHDYS